GRVVGAAGLGASAARSADVRRSAATPEGRHERRQNCSLAGNRVEQDDSQGRLASARGRGLDESGARLALKRHAFASRGEVWAQDELALETASLETAVRLGDLVEGNALGHARLDGVSGEQVEE